MVISEIMIERERLIEKVIYCVCFVGEINKKECVIEVNEVLLF